MSYANFDEHDKLILGGKRVPGRVTVEIGCDGGLDIQKPKGGQAAKIKDEGQPPYTIEVSIVLYAKEHVSSFKSDILPLLQPRSKKVARGPMAIEHPAAALMGVSNVVCDSIKIGVATSKDGWPIGIKLIQWVSKVKEVAKPSEKPKDYAENWAQFADDKARKETPAKTTAPLTNLF